MASAVKTIVATGASSGLGFELIKQLLSAPDQTYRFILGVRDPARTQAAYDALPGVDATRRQRLSLSTLELADIRTVKSFAKETLAKLSAEGVKLDYLVLNAALVKNADEPTGWKSKWCEQYLVNSLSQHYLIHLLREKLVADHSRIIVVSSRAACLVPDPSVLNAELLAGSGTKDMVLYCQTKYTQLLTAHWWRRQLKGQCDVVAVSPGLIPDTGLGRNASYTMPANDPDAKPIGVGAQSIFRAFSRSDFPEDPDQIFLTSWGEWWPKSVYEKSLDKTLQDKWSPSEAEVEEQWHE